VPWIEIDFPEDLTQARDVVLPEVERLDLGPLPPSASR
jgi:choline kinase